MKKILLLLMLSLGLVGCKPKQIITERIVVTNDSAAVLSLQNHLKEKTKEVESLNTELKRVSEENMKLQSDISSHTINYDTNAEVDPQTGEYPKASETITTNKQTIDKEKKEAETLMSDYERKLTAQQTKISNLEYELQQYKSENSELKSKTTPQTGFNFRLASLSFLVGVILSVIIFMRLKKRKIL